MLYKKYVKKVIFSIHLIEERTFGLVSRFFRLFVISSILCIFLLTSLSCSQSEYTGTVGNSKFSFKYANDNYIYPHSRIFISSEGIAPPKLSGDIFNAPVLISIESFQTTNSHIDQFIYFLNNERGIVYFKLSEKIDCLLDGVEFEYVVYTYESFDTMQVLYSGIFLSGVYEEHVIDIDLLSPSESSVEDAFNLLKNTINFSL